MIQDIENLIGFAIEKNLIKEQDYHFVKNRLCYMLKADNSLSAKPIRIIYPSQSLDNLIHEVTLQRPLTLLEAERLRDSVMNIFVPLPSIINERFYEHYRKNVEDAIRYFYDLSLNAYYIKKDRIDKNISYISRGPRKLIITVNLSKPEKDPRDIRAAATHNVDFPKCALCVENEGFQGNDKYDSRINHRLIEIPINGKPYYFHYSPYSYYNEHCIVLSKEHKPMLINHETFTNLLQLLDFFGGNYFFGSNADIPIVGGSILNHDHYQGGRFHFPIEDADVLYDKKIGDVSFEVLDWPLSTIRLRSRNKAALVKYCDLILSNWINYENPEKNIIKMTHNERHNAITPISRKKGEEYEFDLVLRNNRTDSKYELGIFHPHPDVWPIKKENIGLIEVMGLAILPKRLVSEEKDIWEYSLRKGPETEAVKKHKSWFKNVKFTNETELHQGMRDAVAELFEKGLNDCKVLDTDSLIEFLEGVINV